MNSNNAVHIQLYIQLYNYTTALYIQSLYINVNVYTVTVYTIYNVLSWNLQAGTKWVLAYLHCIYSETKWVLAYLHCIYSETKCVLAYLHCIYCVLTQPKTFLGTCNSVHIGTFSFDVPFLHAFASVIALPMIFCAISATIKHNPASCTYQQRRLYSCTIGALVPHRLPLAF